MDIPKIKGEVRRNEPLSRHTSFGIGGPADLLAYPADRNDLVALLERERESLVLLDCDDPGVLLDIDRRADLERLAWSDRRGRDVAPAELTRALVAVTASLPCYRTYIREPALARIGRLHQPGVVDRARIVEVVCRPPPLWPARRGPHAHHGPRYGSGPCDGRSLGRLSRLRTMSHFGSAPVIVRARPSAWRWPAAGSSSRTRFTISSSRRC